MGERLALCIGINYPGTQAELNGCVNDAHDWAAGLTKQGYEVVEMLLDGAATGEAIQDWIAWLVAYLARGDQLVITYSGHGTWVPDADGDEPDSRDEAICPVDLHNGPLLDDWLFHTFAQAAPGSKTATIFDSCFSGTATRMHASYGHGPQVRFLPPAFYLGDKKAEVVARDLPSVVVAPNKPLVKALPVALSLSGLSDFEYSYDAVYGSRFNGALTRNAIDCFVPGQTYSQWHTAIRKRLPSMMYPQTPQLVGLASQKRWKALT